VTIEQLDATKRVHNPGRTAAWLAKQVELGLATVELSLSQYRILGALAEGSAMSSSLAERLAVRPPSVTAVIDGLVARGLVDRTHSEDDRRRISLAMTTEGVAVLESADRAVNERLEQIAAGLPSAKSSARALEDLTLWHEALVVHRAARARR
jgi:DNA-binding MarR family transcriptional regulator